MAISGAERHPGMRVTLNRDASLGSREEWPSTYNLVAGQEFEITRRFNFTVQARTIGGVTATGEARSFVLDNEWLDPATSGSPRGARGGRRRLGTKPDDTDEITYIGIDDPGIQWVWDDLAEYAKGRDWCHDYDRLAEAVGIPGRKRTFGASATLSGIYVSGNVEARSQAEADNIFREALASAATTPTADSRG